MTLTEFLLARIGDDEAVARAAESATVDPADRDYYWTSEWSEPAGDNPWPEQEAHVRRFNPRRVLAECEAKRRSVERAQHAQSAQAAGVINSASIAAEIAWTDALQLLAEVYADHPDYDPAWRP